MSVALGICYADDAPEGAVVAPGDLAIVAAPHCSAATARARLALQVSHSRDLRGFLPFRPREPIEVSAALQLIAGASARLSAQLDACRGLVQFSIALTPSANPIEETGQTWLRHRAAATARLSTARAAIVGLLNTVGARDICAASAAGMIHVIGDSQIGDRIRAVLVEATSGARADALRGHRVAVTGPWPVFARLEKGAPA